MDRNDYNVTELVRLRNNAGLSQKELADILNVSERTIQRAERGDPENDYVGLSLLKKIAGYYEIDYRLLLTPAPSKNFVVNLT